MVQHVWRGARSDVEVLEVEISLNPNFTDPVHEVPLDGPFNYVSSMESMFFSLCGVMEEPPLPSRLEILMSSSWEMAAQGNRR